MRSWDFCRAVDDAVTSANRTGKETSTQALARWREEFGGLYEQQRAGHRGRTALGPFIAQFNCHEPRSRISLTACDGRRTARYETFEALRQYCLEWHRVG